MMIRSLQVALFLTFSLAVAQQPPQRPFPRPGAPPLQMDGRIVDVRVTAVSAHTVRLTVSPIDGSGIPSAFPDEPAITGRAWAPPVYQTRSTIPASTVKAGGLSVEVRTDEGISFQISGPNGRRAQRVLISEETGDIVFSMGAQPLFGLGQGGVQYSRRGNRHLMKTGALDLALNGMRVPVPWLISPEGWALFINRPKGEWDLSGSDGIYRHFPEEKNATVDIFVSIAEDPLALMKEYAGLTGTPSLPPLWAFGYQQSHRTVQDRDHMLRIARTMREKKLPCDVLIYLGTGWCPSGWNEWHGSFDFNKKVFPDWEKDIRALQAMDYKVSLHVVGQPTRLYGTVSDPVLPADDLNQVAQYWKLHQPIGKIIDAWWPDVGENMDDAARIARIRMYWEGSQLDHPNVRPYALHRTGYAGMQRYGGWLWSGDVDARWATLKTHVAAAINTGLSGIPHWGTDVAGFYSTPELTGEFFVRWFQFSAFQPLFRSHGRPSQTRLPWGWNLGNLGEPETDNASNLPRLDELKNSLVEPICKKYLELRYQLMPYLYALVRESSDTGIPILRAMWLHYPKDAQALARGDQYLWGRDILVAPVVEQGAATRVVYLPEGLWYDFWTSEKMAGGREVTRNVDLETMPLYVRAGALIPMGPVIQHTAEKSDKPMTITVYPGADGKFEIYEDDGTTFNHQKGDYLKVMCEWREASRQLTLTRTAGTRALSAQLQRIEVRLAGTERRQQVAFNGRSATVRF